MDNFQFLVNYYKNLPALIKVVWIASSVFFAVFIVLVGYLKYLRFTLRKREANAKPLESYFEQQLITYLYAGNDLDEVSSEQQKIIDDLKIYAEKEFKRKILIETLLKLKNEVSGEVAELIQQLYYKTGLLNYALKKIKNKNWYVIAKGIRELTQFHITEPQKIIEGHLSHKQREVRKEAQLYFVNLFHFKGLEFLSELKSDLTEWDQIQLLEILQKFPEQEIPTLDVWLKSTNNSVVLFALKLAKMYNQYNTKERLLELLNHKNEQVKIQTIKVISHLQIFEAKEILKNTFALRSVDEQIAFVKMLEDMFEPADESFLKEQALHPNFEIKFTALKILKILNIETFKSIEESSVETEHNRVVKFVANN